MINSTNVVLLSGVLRQNPVIANFGDGNRLARFTLCVKRLIQVILMSCNGLLLTLK